MATMRIGGLASGMDIDSLVEKLMVSERAPLDKLEQQKQTYEWQRDAYRAVNTKLQTLDTYIADNLILKSLVTKTATSSNSDYVTAKATSTASGTLSIEGVSQLAIAARKTGISVKKSDDTVADGSTKISDLKDPYGTNNPNPFTGTNEYSILVKSITKDGKLATKATEIKFKATDTINDIVKKINSSGAGVTSLFENGKLSITAENTGDILGEAEIQLVASETIDGETITANGNALFSMLGLGNNLGTTDYSLADGGQNAKFKVNGIATERSSNTFTINGYSITLKEKFNENIVDSNATTTVASSTVTLTSVTDIDDMINKVKDFVTTYNGLVKELNNLTKEEKYREYKPLTKLQKEEMEEKEIELWEEKAKSGLLRGDSIIRSGLSSMRALIYEPNAGVTNTKYNTLYNIGITTSKEYFEGGTLAIDENKLRAALEEDPNAVATLFYNSSGKEATIVNGVEVEPDTRGYLQKLRSSFDDIQERIEERAGRASMNETQYTLGKHLRDVNKRMESWQEKLVNIEDRYWRQFTAMETMINKANNQSAMLMGSFYQ